MPPLRREHIVDHHSIIEARASKKARANSKRPGEHKSPRETEGSTDEGLPPQSSQAENHGEEPTSSQRTMMTTENQTLPLLLLLLLCSCLRPCLAIPRPVAGTSWQLHSIALPTDTIDSDGNEVTNLTPVSSNAEITAHFGNDGSQTAGTLTGSGGCNDYFTDFQVDLTKMGIKFNQVGATEMDCGEDIMEQEFAYFAALAKTSRHEIFGDKLKLRDESGVMLLLFIPLLDNSAHMDGVSTEADILVGTEWRAASYATEDASSGLTPILPGSDVTLEFESDTSFKGLGGCNSYFGSYALSADGRLSIFEMGSTEMGCIDPPGRMDQEVAFFQALQNAAEYRLREIVGVGVQLLLLLDDNGNIILTFVPAGTDGLDLNQDFNTLVVSNTSEKGLHGGKIDGDGQMFIPETVMMEDQDLEINGAAGDSSSARAGTMMSWAQICFITATSMVECMYLLL